MLAPLIITGAVLFGFLPAVPAITPEASLNLSGLSEDPNGSQCYEKMRPDLANCLTDARQAFLDKSGRMRLGKRGPSYRKTLAKGDCVIRQAAIECILKLTCGKCNTKEASLFGVAWYMEQTRKLKEECNLQVASVPECEAKNAVSSPAATIPERSLWGPIIFGIMMALFAPIGTIIVVGSMLELAKILIGKFTSKPIPAFEVPWALLPFKAQRKVILLIILFTASFGVLLLSLLASILALFVSPLTDSISVLIATFLLPTGYLILFVMCFFRPIGHIIGLLSPPKSKKASVELPPPVLPY